MIRGGKAIDAMAADSKRIFFETDNPRFHFPPKGSRSIKIHLVSPQSNVERTGNHCTTSQWFRLFTELGHQVRTSGGKVDDSEVLIALHASHSRDTIRRHRSVHPNRKIVVALSGSDIYPQPDEAALHSMALSDRIVALQERTVTQVPAEERHKVRVIIQSAVPIGHPKPPDESLFPVCVVGHFRNVKDPLRTALAARLLPEDSKILVRHIGGILESHYHALVEQELRENPRFRWLGEGSEQEVANEIASSRVLILTSHFEGGARVVGEAMVHGTPVIASRIEGVIGLLGGDYPGFFPVGDHQALADLLYKVETDADFRQLLESLAPRFAPRFHPSRERDAWRHLLADL